jgi:hypothetical protein
VCDEDFVLDDALDFIIGHDADEENGIEGSGLADFPDDKDYDEDWEDFNRFFTNIARLLDEQSPDSITSDLLSLLDSIFAKPTPYTIEEIGGLMHTIGKLFAYYDSNSNGWVYQGHDSTNYSSNFNDIYNIAKYRLPEIHNMVSDDTGNNYYSFLKIIGGLAEEDGIIEYLSNDISTAGGWEDTFYDLHHFLGGYYVTDPYSPLWPTLAELLEDVGNLVYDSSLVNLETVYEDYGFQVND